MTLSSLPGASGPEGRADAVAAATAAAARCGVRMGVLDTVDELSAAAGLINKTWPSEISVSTLRALRKVGNYVGGAYRGDLLVGACVAFFGSSGSQDLHSHLAVVAPTERSSGIGWALKVSQRAWALEHGVARIQWTYDPLESRNAYVNLAKLAARPVEYLENFYGDHGDGTESVFPTDRLLVSWELPAPRVAVASRGHAVPAQTTDGVPSATLVARDSHGAPREGRDHGERVVLIAAPDDAGTMRARDEPLALEWRMLLRHHLGREVSAGADRIGFTRDGFYVVHRRGG